MNDVFNELDTISSPLVTEGNKILALNFQPFLDQLHKQNPQEIYTSSLLHFMQTLKGENKSGGKNGISRLQYFLNAYAQEVTLYSLNKDILEFINKDHYGLVRNGHGLEAAEFYFYAKNGKTYKVEAKMYSDEGSFQLYRPTTNFHNADYVIIFLTSDKKYRWCFARKEDNYEKLYRGIELIETDPQVLEIKLPARLELLYFRLNRETTDDDVPAKVGYFFTTK